MMSFLLSLPLRSRKTLPRRHNEMNFKGCCTNVRQPFFVRKWGLPSTKKAVTQQRCGRFLGEREGLEIEKEKCDENKYQLPLRQSTSMAASNTAKITVMPIEINCASVAAIRQINAAIQEIAITPRIAR